MSSEMHCASKNVNHHSVGKIAVRLISRLPQISLCFKVAQICLKCGLGVKQFVSGWGAELLGVSSRSQLLTYDPESDTFALIAQNDICRK